MEWPALELPRIHGVERVGVFRVLLLTLRRIIKWCPMRVLGVLCLMLNLTKLGRTVTA